MGQRTVTSAAREAGATIVAMLLALGATAVLATLLALAMATVVVATLVFVAGSALAKGRAMSGGSKFLRAAKEAPLDE